MRKEQKDFAEEEVNHIVNITIVDDYLNKVKIKAKAPSVYINNFLKHNPGLQSALKTHLIGDIKKFGIDKDDYEKFFYARAELIKKEIENRVIITSADNKIELLEEDTEADDINVEEDSE